MFDRVIDMAVNETNDWSVGWLVVGMTNGQTERRMDEWLNECINGLND